MGNTNYRTQRIGVVGTKPYDAYDAVEIEISSEVSNYNVSANTTFFSNLHVMQELLVRSVDGEVGIRFNKPTNARIPIFDGDYFQVTGLSISNVYITTSGAATISLFGMGW